MSIMANQPQANLPFLQILPCTACNPAHNSYAHWVLPFSCTRFLCQRLMTEQVGKNIEEKKSEKNCYLNEENKILCEGG